MNELRVLTQRELAALLTPEISPAYRGMAALYWGTMLSVCAKHKLLVIQTDPTTYARLTTQGQGATIDASLIEP